MNFPYKDFEKASCKDADVEKGLLVDLFNKIEDDNLNVHALVFIKDGNKVFDAYAPGFGPGVTEEIYSISKSFTSVAVGLLYDAGRLGLDDLILKYFPEVSDPLPATRKISIRHLLTMTSGHYTDHFPRLVEAADPVQEFFRLPIEVEPGTRFFYDNTATFLLSAIVTKITGQTVADFLEAPLFRRLMIDKPVWKTLHGYSLGATGLQFDAISLAKFGHLLLNDGMWRDERVVSTQYLREATKFQISSLEAGGPRDRYGYGFQFWINDFGDFRAAGLFKQYIVINREFNIVFVTQGYEGRELLDLVSNFVLPACRKGWLYDSFTLRTFIQRFHDNAAARLEEERKTRTVW